MTNVLLLSCARPGDLSYGGGQRDNLVRDALLRVANVDTITITTDEARLSSQWDHDQILTVQTTMNAGRITRLKEFLKIRRIVAALYATGKYDLVVARYFEKAALVPFAAHRRLIVDGDDFQRSTVGKSIVSRILLGARAVMVRCIAKRALHVWLPDPRDRQSLNIAQKQVSILPNTARGAKEGHSQAREARHRILMVGLYAFPPNEHGLLWFVREVLPEIVRLYPDAELHAVGNYFQQSLRDLGPPVVMRGFVDDLGDEYQQADVVICPIRTGSGTQIKVVEALMHGRPTVVSDFSYRGFADVLRADEHLFVAARTEDWIKKIREVFDDRAQSGHMAHAGQKAVEAAYSHEAFTQRVVTTLRECGAA